MKLGKNGVYRVVVLLKTSGTSGSCEVSKLFDLQNQSSLIIDMLDRSADF
jgi:hypothetical protein